MLLRSSLESSFGSTLDICRIVIPTQMTRNPMISVIMDETGAESPLKSTIVVRIEKNVTAGSRSAQASQVGGKDQQMT